MQGLARAADVFETRDVQIKLQYITEPDDSNNNSNGPRDEAAAVKVADEECSEVAQRVTTMLQAVMEPLLVAALRRTKQERDAQARYCCSPKHPWLSDVWSAQRWRSA